MGKCLLVTELNQNILGCVFWSFWNSPFHIFVCSREKYSAFKKSTAQNLAHLDQVWEKIFMTHASFILIYLASYSVDVDRISVNKTFMDFKM